MFNQQPLLCAYQNQDISNWFLILMMLSGTQRFIPWTEKNTDQCSMLWLYGTEIWSSTNSRVSINTESDIFVQEGSVSLKVICVINENNASMMMLKVWPDHAADRAEHRADKDSLVAIAYETSILHSKVNRAWNKINEIWQLLLNYVSPSSSIIFIAWDMYQ